MLTSVLFGAKNLGFFEIYGIRTDKGRGLSQSGHSSEKGFCDFVRTSFYGWAPNHVTLYH